MRRITGIGLDTIASWALQLRRRSHHTLHPGIGERPSQPETRRASLIDHPQRRPQLTQPTHDLAVIRTQPRPSDLTGHLINGVRHH
jgi:hypothetical protein